MVQTIEEYMENLPPEVADYVEALQDKAYLLGVAIGRQDAVNYLTNQSGEAYRQRKDDLARNYRQMSDNIYETLVKPAEQTRDEKDAMIEELEQALVKE